MRHTTSRLRVALIGVLLWCGIGALVAGLLVLAMSASNAFAVSGLALVVLSLGWAIGPFKTPMVWSEGALMSYAGNTSADDARRPPSAWRRVAVPAYAFVAGLLLLAADWLA